ncbi:hypothetical protein N44_03337 [Microcystis aeruginosa NIES-44]|uniref:Uncharacterized protein n=1 Tax=Microcystis aeruginosa NIES-44 TaxID=449439 RepID=A0A0A1VZN5_MICAE|nr:hypothetical protein N44_03337 [Microcystis aeruginosa NIES-44]
MQEATYALPPRCRGGWGGGGWGARGGGGDSANHKNKRFKYVLT